MSSPLTGEEILYYQRLLSACGYYKDTIDGEWGPNTADADAAFLADSDKLKKIGTFDARTEKNVATLHIKAQKLARQFMVEATKGHLTVKIISGNRTYAQQNALYRQGRFGNPGPIVTNARGGQSNHNFGIAWDIGLFRADGSYLTGSTTAEVHEYEAVFDAVSALPLEWGGKWKSFRDIPHYQHPTGMTVSAVRELFEAGKPYI